MLTEAMARKAIKEIMDSPERSSRNLVDMALNFAEGQYLREFLFKVQSVLKDENSPYYRMIIDSMNHIDTEKLINFGMNIGYNSVTIGSPKIREIEQKENFDIPWSLYLDMKNYSDNNFEKYNKLLKEGRNLGIFSYLIGTEKKVQDVLKLVSKHNDCAFVIFVKSKEITEEFIEKASCIDNIMIAVKASEDADRACLLLRNNKMLYSIYFHYEESDYEHITSGEFIENIETLRPTFTIFAANDGCKEDTSLKIYDYIKKTRLNQSYITIPWDAIYDTRYIDGKISDNICSAAIDANGLLIKFRDGVELTELNVFNKGLHDSLKEALPKNK